MNRFAVMAVVLVASACSEQPGSVPEETRDMSREMLGRWDVTAREGEDTYPLWFELEEEGETFHGCIQPRFGHTLPLDSVEVTGNEAALRLAGDTYAGFLTNDCWNGTGRKENGTPFEWTAVRALELDAVEKPQWGEPVEIFNGQDLSGWVARHPSQTNMWKAEDGVLANKDTGSDLVTEAVFMDFKLHIEVNYPAESNSGIYLRGRYEIQVQDDYGKEPHSRHLGGVYGHVTPTENAAKPAGEWQVFDITLLGRWVTVVLNEKAIIDHQEIPGITGGALDSREGEPGPIMLQGDHGPVSYRNIVVTPVQKSP